MTEETTNIPDWVKKYHLQLATQNIRGNEKNILEGWEELHEKASTYIAKADEASKKELLFYTPTLKEANAMLADGGFDKIPNTEQGNQEFDTIKTRMFKNIEIEIKAQKTPQETELSDSQNGGTLASHERHRG